MKLTTQYKFKKKNLHCFSPQANYTDRATAACRRSLCQLLRMEGITWSAQRIHTAFIMFAIRTEKYLLLLTMCLATQSSVRIVLCGQSHCQ
jgi:hypothetical protein